MRRTAVGIIALLMLAVSTYGFYRYGFEAGEASFFWNSCLRMGLVLGAAWLALPKLLEQKSDASPLVLTLVAAIVLVLVVRPRAIIFLWPFLVILAVMQFFRWLVKPPPGKAKKKRKTRIAD